MRVLVTTPTGHIGKRVIQRLMGHAEIAVFVRNPARLSTNVTVHTGNLEDAAALTRAATGADAMLLIIPPNLTVTDWGAWMHQVASNGAQAIRANHVRRVIFLSSFGAQRPGLGPITLLGKAESVIREAAPNLTILRSAYFMENLLSSVPTVRDANAVYNVFAPDFQFPMIATRDVADVAAERLLDTTWSGQSIRGAAGMSEAVVNGYGEMLRGLATTGVAAEPRSPETTTPTTIDEFARTVFAPAVTASSSDSSLLHAV